MKPSNDDVMKTTENRRRYEAMSYDGVDMHLFDEDVDEQNALCGADTSDDLRGVPGYLEDRVHGLWVGNICQECKVLAVPLADEVIERMVDDLGAEGRNDMAEDSSQLGKALARETCQISPSD